VAQEEVDQLIVGHNPCFEFFTKLNDQFSNGFLGVIADGLEMTPRDSISL